MNVVLKKNNVVPVINLKVDGEGSKNLFNTGFYTRFKHPLDSNYFEEIKKKYNSLNPNGYSFGVLFVMISLLDMIISLWILQVIQLVLMHFLQ